MLRDLRIDHLSGDDFGRVSLVMDGRRVLLNFVPEEAESKVSPGLVLLHASLGKPARSHAAWKHLFLSTSPTVRCRTLARESGVALADALQGSHPRLEDLDKRLFYPCLSLSKNASELAAAATSVSGR